VLDETLGAALPTDGAVATLVRITAPEGEDLAELGEWLGHDPELRSQAVLSEHVADMAATTAIDLAFTAPGQASLRAAFTTSFAAWLTARTARKTSLEISVRRGDRSVHVLVEGTVDIAALAAFLEAVFKDPGEGANTPSA
jgi:Effector Associated Constant Component 1